MPSIYDVQIGQRFSFQVYPEAILGYRYQDVRLEGIISARTAVAYGFDIQALHANVYPSLPPGQVPNDPYQYNYVRIQHPSGEFEILGVPWIRPESIEISTGGRIVMSFDDKTQMDLDRILAALSSNGYRPDDVKVTP